VKPIKPDSGYTSFKEAPELPRSRAMNISGLKLIASVVKQVGGNIKIEEDGSAEIIWPQTATAGSTRRMEGLIRLIDDFNASVAALDVPLPVRRLLGRIQFESFRWRPPTLSPAREKLSSQDEGQEPYRHVPDMDRGIYKRRRQAHS
jgi:hypothetical protein